MTAKQRKQRSKVYNLQEIAGNVSGKVDREAHVVRDVKLLGLVSKNKARYSDSALAAGVNLYEGARANFDHPGAPTDPREYGQKFGTYRNVRHKPGEGLYGDLHYNPKHNLIEQFLWDAENDPSSLGLSPNHRVRAALGADGWKDVQEINLVRSVDVVPNPGTTQSLFEYEDERMSKNLTSLLRLASPHGKKFADLLEMEGLDVTTPLGALPDTDPAEAVEEALAQTVMTIFKDPTVSPEDTGQKVADLAQIVIDVKSKVDPGLEADSLAELPPEEPQETPPGEEAPSEDAPPEDAPSDEAPSDEPPADEESSDSPFPPKDEDEDKTEAAIERLVKVVDHLSKRDSARTVLESANIPVSTLKLTELMECDNEVEMRAMVRSWPGRKRGAVKPQIDTVGSNSNGTIPTDRKERLSRYLQK